MMKKKAKKPALLALLLATSALAPSMAAAAEVRLKSNDGGIDLIGEFVELKDDHYVINTALGQLRIAAGRVQCEGDACPQAITVDSDVVIVGSDTIGVGLMPFLIDGYATSKDGIVDEQNQSGSMVKSNLVANGGYGDPIGSFSVASTSSADAFSGLRDPAVKIGMSSRRILPAEARQLRNFGAGNMIDIDQEHVVAVDSISVVVNAENPLSSISLQDLERVFSGEVRNWAEIGGPNAPIMIYTREASSGTTAVFSERVFEQTGRSITADAIQTRSSEEMASAVRSDPNAIGFVPSAFERGTKALALQASCGLTSMPTAFNAKTEEYPLQRRLYLYNRVDNLDSTTQDFINYALSPEADELIAKSGLVSLSVSTVPQDLQSDRVRSVLENAVDPFEFGLARTMLLDMFEWDRLSTTFRFASGSARLDGKGLVDLERLLDFLREQPAGTQIAVVGFTDADGAFASNQNLSVGRAQRIADEIRAAGGADLNDIAIEVRGYGELSPAACNDTLEGKRINRRVEIWMRS